MCEIDSIVCVHPKKQKEVTKIPSLFLNTSNQSHNKKSNSNFLKDPFTNININNNNIKPSKALFNTKNSIPYNNSNKSNYY